VNWNNDILENEAVRGGI